MTGFPPRSALLRQVLLQSRVESTIASYPVVGPTELLIGRDPRCHIVLDSQTYGGVSRQHAKISPCRQAASGWQVVDLNSANGTFVNGRRVLGQCNLRWGDRITLAQDGPQFIFELYNSRAQEIASASSPKPGAAAAISTTHRLAKQHPFAPPPDDVTLSQLFPILSTGQDLRHKAYLVPGSLTVAFVVLMFLAIGNPIVFNLLLAMYLAGAAFYFVYQLCGKHKPWWLLLGTAGLTILLLTSPILRLFILVFREVLPGSIPVNDSTANFLTLLVRMFFGAGLMEELLKAIPVFLLYWLGTQLRSPKREQIGVWEPLDGILLGTASAVGFTLLETLWQYVPTIINLVELEAGNQAAQEVGIQLLIPRVLGSISGHMAYSGYFGYFIGLSVLKPNQRWQILAVGYLTAAVLHALWNATGGLNFFVLAVVGMVSYAFLAAAILKARALSPTRAQNFATRFSSR